MDPHKTLERSAIADIRQDYRLAALNESDAGDDPIALFRRWFEEAVQAQVNEVNAFSLSTINAAGRPSSRILLLKGIEADSFTFFTNYQSNKGKEIELQNAVALVFLWAPLERQVRIEGFAIKVSEEASDAYFHSRPIGSRLGAWASPQSTVIASREVLQAEEARYNAQWGDRPPRPPHWGGYRVVPDMIEFWQGRSSRLHDRLRYRREAPSPLAAWHRERLAP
ncbi:MAG: pyridoxamine 5'-phosphate oxidase [Betaproteobacteria bacterium]|nr:pyridoxamine 5'-phosphate oxidase [Betaproteobacteria bacterium]